MGNQSEVVKAWLRGGLTLLAVVFGAVVGTTVAPRDDWEWIKFVSGIGIAMIPKLIEMLSPSKGIVNVNTAAKIDRMIEAKSDAKAEVKVQTLMGSLPIPPDPR